MEPSDHQFVEDFKEALEDLQINNRYDIQNLTLIARENTEHARAIALTLQDHIKRVAPHKKLPSLYVLDSIVKNVGTPYTLYFGGKKLFDTFMGAYASVDMNTRRKMDEMLKTWKEPIPGSIDTRPVFPADMIRPIENALLQARTSAMHQQQQNLRNEQSLLGRGRQMGQGAPVPYRETPTPPGGARPPSQASGYPGSNGAPYGYPTQAPPAQYPTPTPTYQSMPSRSTPQPQAGLNAFQPPYSGGYGVPQPGISVDSLKGDLNKLIAASKAVSDLNPHDRSIQTKLKALLDLQSILQHHDLPQSQLVPIKDKIAELSVTIRVPPAPAPTPSFVPIHQPVAVAPPPAAGPKVTIDSILGPGALAALLARGSASAPPAATPQVSTPQPAPATVAIRSPPPPQRIEPPKPAASATPDPMSLMAMLRQAGMLPATTPSNGAPPVASAIPSFPPPIPTAGPRMLDNSTRDTSFVSLSLKQTILAIPLLFDHLGMQCNQCGRRFKSDEEGKKKKMAHMDWHFKVNQRIAEADKIGQHRSWFVDELDWLNSREMVDQDGATSVTASKGGQESKSKDPKDQWIPVPDDPVLTNSVCPICQEKFTMQWHNDAQDFVWVDAMRVGDRIYHASCHKEATGGSGNMAMYSRSTPEPVLGKRKAEDELMGIRGKIKTDGA